MFTDGRRSSNDDAADKPANPPPMITTSHTCLDIDDDDDALSSPIGLEDWSATEKQMSKTRDVQRSTDSKLKKTQPEAWLTSYLSWCGDATAGDEGAF
jgi:hypothetical protein